MFDPHARADRWAQMCADWAQDASFAATHHNLGLIANWKLNEERERSNNLPISEKPQLNPLWDCDVDVAYNEYIESSKTGESMPDKWKIRKPYPVDENTWRTQDAVLPQPPDPIQGIDVGSRTVPYYLGKRGDVLPAGTIYNHSKYGRLEKVTPMNPFSGTYNRWRAADDAAELIWSREMRRLGY